MEDGDFGFQHPNGKPLDALAAFLSRVKEWGCGKAREVCAGGADKRSDLSVEGEELRPGPVTEFGTIDDPRTKCGAKGFKLGECSPSRATKGVARGA